MLTAKLLVVRREVKTTQFGAVKAGWTREERVEAGKRKRKRASWNDGGRAQDGEPGKEERQRTASVWKKRKCQFPSIRRSPSKCPNRESFHGSFHTYMFRCDCLGGLGEYVKEQPEDRQSAPSSTTTPALSAIRQRFRNEILGLLSHTSKPSAWITTETTSMTTLRTRHRHFRAGFSIAKSRGARFLRVSHPTSAGKRPPLGETFQTARCGP